MPVESGKEEPNMFGHIYQDKRTTEGYAICEKCWCRENTDEAASKCIALQDGKE